MTYIVQLESGVWISKTSPSYRTLVRKFATRYLTERSANRALSNMRKMLCKDFSQAVIEKEESQS